MISNKSKIDDIIEKMIADEKAAAGGYEGGDSDRDDYQRIPEDGILAELE